MNRIMIGVAACCLAVTVFALTSEEKTAAMRKRSGGIVVNYAAMKGQVLFLNTQKRVPADPLAKRIKVMADAFMSRFELKEWENPISITNATDTLKAAAANAAVFIVDDPSLPATLLTAPEGNFAFINVAALAKDGANGQKLMERTRRELWRAIGYLFTADSFADVCVLNTVTSLEQLDNLGAEAPSQGPQILMHRHLGKIGVKPFQRSTYRRALEEGWAPMPTNDLQRAVYEKWMKEKGKK